MRLLLTAGLAIGLWASLPAAAQQIDSREGIALRDQILELHQEVQGLRDQLARSQAATGGSLLGGAQAPPPAAGGPSADIATQLLDRVQRLEDQVRQLRGRVDEADNARQRSYDDLAKQIGDLNFKLDQGARGAAAATPPAAASGGNPVFSNNSISPPPANLANEAPGTSPTSGDALPVPPAPPPPPAKRSSETILQDGNAALARHDYAAAQAAAREVLAMPKAPRTTDAQYLLAQSLAGQKDYSGAAVAFDDTYNRSHTGGHAQESLLGLANALTELKERRAACETLDKLHAEFPTLRADLVNAAAASRKAAGCR